MFEKEKEKLLQEAGDDRFKKMMAEQIIEIMTSAGTGGEILREDRKLEDLKKIFDQFAKENKEGNQSVITPSEAAEMIKDFYVIKKKDFGNIDVLSLF